MKHRRTDSLSGVWPIVLLGLAGIAVHSAELVGGRPYFRDLYQVYVPAKHYLAERLRAGELPQWWPWDGGGSPLIPQPVFSIFHPTTLFYLILPFWNAFALQDLFGTWMALFGAYVLARTLGLPRAAATVSGTIYGLNGYLACLTEHQFMKLSAGTMPWYLAAIVIAVRRGGGWLVLPSVAMGLLLLAGDPQIAILSSIAGVALALVVRRDWTRIVVALVSPLAGAALAAVQLIPSILVQDDTERSLPVTAEKWSLDWNYLAGMIWPTNFGATGWARSTFIGAPGIALVLIALMGLRIRKRRSRLALLLVLAIGSVWLAFGSAGGLHLLARQAIPFWAKLRYPMKSVVLAYLAIALLAGYGFRQVARRRFRWIGASAIAAHSVAFAYPLFPTMPKDFYEPSVIAQMLQNDGVGPIGAYFDRPLATLHGEDQWHIDAHTAGGGLGTSLGAMWGLPCLTPSMPGSSWRILELFDSAHRDATNSRLLGTFGVGFVVLPEPVNVRPAKMVLERDGGFALVQMKHSLPRAYSVQRARVAASIARDDSINTASAADFLPGREVIIDAPDAHPDWESRPVEPAVPAIIQTGTPSNVVRVLANLSAPGFVVLNQAAFSGRSATLDGKPATNYIANGLVQAVEAPAGDHVIDFRYDTPGLRVGFATSIIAALLMIAAAFLLRQRTKRVG